MANLQEPLWKDITGYEGLYAVSSDGDVKALTRISRTGMNLKMIRIYPEKILKQSLVVGYCKVNLCKDGVISQFKVHRLVASAFHDNPNNYPCVNHIDGNKENNKSQNLEWCNDSQNAIHAFANKLRKGIIGAENPSAKKILNTKTNEVFNTLADAASAEGVGITTLSVFFNKPDSINISKKMRSRLSKYVIQT